MKYYLSAKAVVSLIEGGQPAVQGLVQQGRLEMFFYLGWLRDARLEFQTLGGDELSLLKRLEESGIHLTSALGDDWRGAGDTLAEREWNSVASRESEKLCLLVVGDESAWCANRNSFTNVCDLVEGPENKDPSIPFIDLVQQQRRIRGQLEAGMMTVLDHGKYIMGPEVRELENVLASYVGVDHCISVASGTDSLLIALMALGVGPGDEVVTVPFTWISTAEVIALLGATPVFVDIEPEGWNMNPDLLEAKITSRTKAIMPVGIFGQMAQMERICRIAQDHGNIPVIEDAAQCFGATENGVRSCGASLIGSTSFFPSKPLGCYGDGGALFTDDGEIADRMRQIRVHGQKVKHHHPLLGLNGRLDTLQAAVLLEKFKLYEEEIQLREKVAQLYESLFSEFELTGLVPQGSVKGVESVFAQYTVLCADRENVAQKLKNAEIPAVSYYQNPLHLQPVFSGLGHSKGDFPVSENVSSSTISLPMSPYLQETEQRRVVKALSS